MSGPGAPRRTAWIVAPPALCSLCREPLTRPEENSAWNGKPAHRDCVRIRLLNRDPAFRDWGAEPSSEDAPEDPANEAGHREDEDEGA